jgi:hypothetical protein
VFKDLGRVRLQTGLEEHINHNEGQAMLPRIGPNEMGPARGTGHGYRTKTCRNGTAASLWFDFITRRKLYFTMPLQEARMPRARVFPFNGLGAVESISFVPA